MLRFLKASVERVQDFFCPILTGPKCHFEKFGCFVTSLPFSCGLVWNDRTAFTERNVHWLAYQISQILEMCFFFSLDVGNQENWLLIQAVGSEFTAVSLMLNHEWILTVEWRAGVKFQFVGQEQGLQFSSWRCSSERITQMITGKSCVRCHSETPTLYLCRTWKSKAIRLRLRVRQYCCLSCLKQSLPLLFMFPAAWCSMLTQLFVQLCSELTC